MPNYWDTNTWRYFQFLQKIKILTSLFTLMPKAVTPTKVSAYRKETPKTYKEHDGKVLGYVPKGSPAAIKKR